MGPGKWDRRTVVFKMIELNGGRKSIKTFEDGITGLIPKIYIIKILSCSFYLFTGCLMA